MKVDKTRLVSLQSLCVRLRLLLSLFEHEGALGGRCGWSGVANLLLPAACVTRLEADASAADLYDARLYCEPSADYDERQSRMLDDYMSALARYHFVWNAYATVRDDSDAGRLMKTKNPADRSSLDGRVPQAHVELLDQVSGPCRSLTQGSREIQERLKTNQVETVGLGRAGRLATGFRNYLVHGDEAPPERDDWDDQFRAALDGEETISPALLSASRVLSTDASSHPSADACGAGWLHHGGDGRSVPVAGGWTPSSSYRAASC